jgi:hypothetical protein
MKSRTQMQIGFVLFAAIGSLQTGCGSRAHEVVRVQLKVTIEGKPPVGATVMLHPLDAQSLGKRKPTGTVGEDGAVRFSTFKQNDGVPAGEYVVTVVLYREERDENLGKIVRGDDQINEKFGDPNNANAPRIKVERGKKSYAPIDL